MRLLRSAVVALGATTVLLAAHPAHAAFTVQGESASSWTTECGDGGDPAMGPRFSGSTNTMFFPSGGCSATYTGTVGTIKSARFHLSGIAGTQCGLITVSGVTSATADVCVTNDTWAVANFGSGAIVASTGFTVSWEPDSFIVNLWLDYLSGDTI